METNNSLSKSQAPLLVSNNLTQLSEFFTSQKFVLVETPELKLARESEKATQTSALAFSGKPSFPLDRLPPSRVLRSVLRRFFIRQGQPAAMRQHLRRPREQSRCPPPRSTRFDIPEAHRTVVARGGSHPAIGAKTKVIHLVAVSAKDDRFIFTTLPRGSTNDVCRTVIAWEPEPAAIGVNIKPIDATLGTTDGDSNILLEVPELRRFPTDREGELVAVRAKAKAVDLAGKAGQ